MKLNNGKSVGLKIRRAAIIVNSKTRPGGLNGISSVKIAEKLRLLSKRLLCSVQQNGQLNYGVVTSLPKSNSLNETILFPTTTRIQTASILTEFDENPILKHAVGQPKRWELCWGFSVKVQTATNTLITLFSLLFY